MAATSNEVTEELLDLRALVLDYKPGKAVVSPDKVQFPEHLFIGLFGRTGCGKSSLINSLKYAVLGRLRRAQWMEVASQEKAGGHTMFRKIANLTQSIFAIDNRGLDDPNTEQALQEVAAQLDGNRGYSQQVRWSGGDEVEDQGVDIPAIDLKTGHQISCAVFVFSAIHDIGTSINGLDEVVDFLHRHQGRYPVAVITHVDVADRKTVDILCTVLRVSGVSDIYEVANITTEKTKLEEQYQLNLLTLIERCMTVGDETVLFKHYQRSEFEKQAEIRRRSEQAARERRDVTSSGAAAGRDRRPRPEVDGREAEHQADSNTERRALEEERRQVDLLKYENERRKMELEFMEREHSMRLEFEKQKVQMQRERQEIESREKQLQEEERERRYREALQHAEADKQREITRIMEANRAQPSQPLIACKLQ